jgi:hypothetical protein
MYHHAIFHSKYKFSSITKPQLPRAATLSNVACGSDPKIKWIINLLTLLGSIPETTQMYLIEVHKKFIWLASRLSALILIILEKMMFF